MAFVIIGKVITVDAIPGQEREPRRKFRPIRVERKEEITIDETPFRNFSRSELQEDIRFDKNILSKIDGWLSRINELELQAKGV